MTPMTFTQAKNAIQEVVRPTDLFRVREAAMMVGLNPETIHRRIRRGEIRAWGSPQRVSLNELLPIYMPKTCQQ